MQERASGRGSKEGEGSWDGAALNLSVMQRRNRTRDLMRAGVMKEKPLWYDVYEAFPPLREPVFRRPRQRYGKAKDQVPEVLYEEDRIRAKFYSVYGSGPRIFDLFNPNFKSSCQRFVEKYIELQKKGETDEDTLFVETGKALLAEGIILRRRGEGAIHLGKSET